jgi:hypothetical protein
MLQRHHGRAEGEMSRPDSVEMAARVAIALVGRMAVDHVECRRHEQAEDQQRLPDGQPA